MESLQKNLFSFQIADLDDKEVYFKLGFPIFNQLKMLIHYHLKCSQFTDNTGDIEI